MGDLMANQYVRTAIREHHQFEHIFRTCQMVAFPIQSFERLFQPSSPSCRYFEDLVAGFGALRGLGAVLEWKQFSGLTRRKADAIRRRWWCNLGQIEMVWARNSIWRESGMRFPCCALLGTDGLLQPGTKCTTKRCYRNG